MPKAQSWLENTYSENTKKIFVRNKNLEGELIIKAFPNLEWIEIRDNANLTSIEIANLPKLVKFNINGCQISNLTINNCPEINHLNVGNNQLTETSFLTNLNPEKLTYLSIHSNNFVKQGLEFLNQLVIERVLKK